MKKILIFGGSFNPIHIGHIRMARRAADFIGADKILLIPSKIPPHKSGKYLAADGDRLNMCTVAAKADQRMEASGIELALEGVSYTVRTLELLKDKFKDAELYFLMGADMLLCFDKWKQPDKILTLASVLAVPRDEGEAEVLRKYADEKFGDKNITVIDCEKVNVSSTEIRQMIKSNDEAVIGLLPDGVYDYIKQHKLYGSDRT